MLETTLGSLRVRIFGGEDRQGGGRGPAVVFCHGFGAPGDDMVPLARALDVPRSVRWFVPEAPLEVDVGMGLFGPPGRAWWAIDMMRIQERIARGEQAELSNETPEGLPAAKEAFTGMLEALRARFDVTDDELVLGGFSQGAMLSTELVLSGAVPARRLAILSGALLSAERWLAAMKTRAPGLRVFQAHGLMDPILPFTGAERLRRGLEEAGAEVTWVSHRRGHEVPPAVTDGLAAWLRGLTPSV